VSGPYVTLVILLPQTRMSLIPCGSDQCSQSFIHLEYGNRKCILVNMPYYNSMATGMAKYDVFIHECVFAKNI
jgi:hypothetical protein